MWTTPRFSTIWQFFAQFEAEGELPPRKQKANQLPSSFFRASSTPLIAAISTSTSLSSVSSLPLQGYKNVINFFWCSWTMQKRSIAGCILSGMLRKQKYLILAKIRAIPHKWVGAEANEFFVRCNGRFWRFTGGKSKNLQAADGGKGIAYAANELCGIALITVASLPDTGIDTLRSVPPTITEVRTR